MVNIEGPKSSGICSAWTDRSHLGTEIPRHRLLFPQIRYHTIDIVFKFP